MSHPPHGQFALLAQRRFAPFFWTQFLGAANDNLFKFALTVLVTYQLQLRWLPPAQAGVVIGAVFIAPFLIFSATAGQITDKLEKSALIRFTKNLEVGIMGLAALGFLLGSIPLLLACVFGMGLQSTIFGPVKFAYLPAHLDERELTGGNGLVEMGTFVAILLGNVAGGLLISLERIGPAAVAAAGIVLAVIGRIASGAVPPTPATAPELRIRWNPVTETIANLKLAYQHLAVFRSMLGISWMWFFGAVFLSNFPSFARDVLHGDERVASALLVVFSVGIAAGSLACEGLSRRHVEIGLVPLGALGMSVFAFDLWLASRALPPSALMGVGEFLARPSHWRILVDLALLAASAGLFSVPMVALVQLRSPPTHRARIIGANNILNALFMIGASVIVSALLASGVSVPAIFGLTAAVNLVVTAWIFTLVPEYVLRFVAFVLSRFVYRFEVDGDAHVPTEGAAVIAPNHVSFADAVLVMAASPRPIRFLMDHRIFRTPVLGAVFRLSGAIPIAPRADDEAAYDAAFARASDVLADGELLGIFPEGAITRDGRLQPFKGGIMKILADHPVPVIPVGLRNLWGSFFSRVDGAAMSRPFRRGLWSRVTVAIGDPLPPLGVQPDTLRAAVAALIGEPDPPDPESGDTRPLGRAEASLEPDPTVSPEVP